MNVYLTIILCCKSPNLSAAPKTEVPKLVPLGPRIIWRSTSRVLSWQCWKVLRKHYRSQRFDLGVNGCQKGKPEWHGKGGSTFLLDCGATAVWVYWICCICVFVGRPCDSHGSGVCGDVRTPATLRGSGSIFARKWLCLSPLLFTSWEVPWLWAWAPNGRLVAGQEGVYPPFPNPREETLELESNRIRDWQ